MNKNLPQDEVIKQKTKKEPRVEIKYSIFDKIIFIFKTIIFIIVCVIAFYFYTQFKNIKDKVETIYKLQCIVKNLKANYPIAELTITDITNDYISIKINYYKQDGNIFFEGQQDFSVKGKTFYLDCTVYNFAFSLIETGSVKNFAIPFRIYSDLIPPDNGIYLKNADAYGVPFVLYDTANVEDQATRDLQRERLINLMDVINNVAQRKKLGILRSVYKNALGNASQLKKGTVFILKIEQTGGITLKQKNFFERAFF